MKLFLHKPIIQEFTITRKSETVLDEIEDIKKNLDSNMSKELIIPPDVIDSLKIKTELNPKIWIDDELNPRLKSKLIKLAKDFYKDLNIPEKTPILDILFTGSLANYNWSKYSDIDLHIVIDFSKFDADKSFIEDYFYAQKSIWNNEHNIEMYGFPIEIYIQDKNHNLRATGVYSLIKNKWLKKPNIKKFTLDKDTVKNKTLKFLDKLKNIKSNYLNHQYQKVIDEVGNIKDKITKMRNSGLEKGGEFSIENLVFKTIRRTPFMDILDSYKAKSYDKLMSISESKQLIKNILRENLKDYKELPAGGNDKEARMGSNGKWHTISPLSRDISDSTKNKIKSDIDDATNIVKSQQEPIKSYANDPHNGSGTYKVIIDKNGKITTQLTTATGNMPNQGNTDVGNFRTSLKEPFVMYINAAINGKGVLYMPPNSISPASDAKIKALAYFGNEILAWLDNKTSYGDNEAKELSVQQLMADPNLKKLKKDIENFWFSKPRKLTDSQWLEIIMSIGRFKRFNNENALKQLLSLNVNDIMDILKHDVIEINKNGVPTKEPYTTITGLKNWPKKN